MMVKYEVQAPAPRQSHGILTRSRMEKTAHSGKPEGVDLSWIRSDSSLCLGKERPISMESRSIAFAKIVDLLNWIGSPIRFPPNLSFVYVVYFIRAHLRGASPGTRLSGDIDRS